MNQNVLLGFVIGLVVIVVAGWLFFANQTVTPSIPSPTPLTIDTTESTGPLNTITPVPSPLTTSLTSPAPSSSPTVSPVSQGTVKEVTVHGSAFKFDPAQIKVKQGDTVRVTFINDEGTHDWRLDEFQAATPVIQGGKQATVEFIASQKGQFEYYCSVANHRQMGMKGTLIVE